MHNISNLKMSTSLPNHWQNCFGVALTIDHKNTIENGEWLCDYIIHASHMLMKNTYPSVGGLIIIVKYCDLQWQKEGSDCGFFAIAFAVCL